MNTRKFFNVKRFGRQMLMTFFALMLATGLAANQAPNPALAMPRSDPTDTDPIGVGGEPPPYSSPAGGFSWAIEKRFGPDHNGDGMVDYHWNPVTMKYDPAYIYPNSWEITFNGCQTANDYYKYGYPLEYEPDYLYQWRLDSTVISSSCKFNRPFFDKSLYTMELTTTKVADNSVTTYPAQSVQVKDYFIVSIGDSYASGQGNPDIEQEVISGFLGFGWVQVSPARWQDERCMRSANAAPALAALALEASDPHSSVTFISFACTGASIMNNSYDFVLSADGSPLWENRGVGILGPYRGEITDVPYEDYEHYIPAQITQVWDAMATVPEGQSRRQIDALLISGGGNDLKFPAMISQCTTFTNCWFSDLAKIAVNPVTDTEWYTLYDTVNRIVGEWGDAGPLFTLPYDYAALGYEINLLDPKPAHVYVTQYPDPTINDKGTLNTAEQHHCRMLDDVLWPNPLNVVTDLEAETASHHAQTKLNTTIRIAVQNLASAYPTIDWQFVDGLSVFDVDPDPAVAGKPGYFMGGPDGGPGHGYCASDNWIRRADESELIQGPVNVRKDSLGTMHPNYSGQQAIKTRILRYMQPDLIGQSQVQAPSFSFSYNSGGLTSQPGLNGWYLGSCDTGGNCSYPKVVGQAVATSALTLNGASIWANDTDGCNIPGVNCSVTLSTDQKQITYKVEISATGTYRFQFNAQDANGQAGFLQKEIKVDLEDPILATPIGPFEVEEGGSVELSAHVATYLAGNPPEEFPTNNDYLVNFDWDLDNDGIFEMEDEPPMFSAVGMDGPATLPVQVQVMDRAGRTATGQAEVHILDTSPAVTIEGAPASGSEGTTIHLTNTVSPGVAGDYTYVWEVKKDGNFYISDEELDFGFTPNDNGVYEVSLTVTNASGNTGTASLTINVTNVAPAAAINGAPAASPEGTAIHLSAAVFDPATGDTFSYDWSVAQGDTVLATGTNPEFSFTPPDNGEYLVSLKVTDDDGGEGSASQAITVTNVAPSPTIQDVPGSPMEGMAISLSGAAGDPGASDTFTYAWSVSQGETVLSTGSDATFSFTPEDNGAYLFSLKVTDDDGGEGSASQAIDVSNAAPVLGNMQYNPSAVDEGGSVSVSGSITDPGTKDSLTLAINWGDGSAEETQSLAAGTTSFTASHTYADDNPTATASDANTITVKVTDKDAGSDTNTFSVTVSNLTPGVTLTGPAVGALYAVNSTVSVSANVSDASASDILSCSVVWDDGATTTGTMAAGSCSASHIYKAAGVYSIQVTGTDDDTGSDSETVMVVVYDPSAGFVTGGGWIDSPAGAYKLDESLSGKATFGFVSQYKKGATLPSGNTEFHFQTGGLKFHSTAYDWLVVNRSACNAQFKGEGLINGAPDANGNAYKFMLWAGDGSPDTFRIRIWSEDAAGEHDVYDNGVDQALSGGSIVVHTRN